MARTRTVFPTARIAHLWAHQAQSEARNPQGNLYFRDRVLFSYRDSYPIGNLIPMKSKPGVVGLVLIQEDRYGNTTSRHISHALQATNHLRTIEVPYLLVDGPHGSHVGNLKWFDEQIKDATGKAMRSRTSTEWKLQWLEGLVKDANDYCGFFKIKQKFKNDLTVENMTEMRVKAREADKARKIKNAVKIERDRKAQERKDALERPKAQERLDAWRNGGPRPSSNDCRVLGLRRELTGDLLRVKGDMVETSQGAEFPVSHVRLGLALVRQVMTAKYQMLICLLCKTGHEVMVVGPTGNMIANGITCTSCESDSFYIQQDINGVDIPPYGKNWRTNGHTLHLGHYKIDRIMPDGTVYAGCHIVKWAEIERIAGQIESAVEEVQA